MSQSAWAGTLYVDASKSGDGSSWANAYASLQTALGAAISGNEVLVATGTYYPTTETDRTISFQLANGIAIYGGYPTGGGTRDWNAHVTTLSGDLNQDDVPDFGNRTENSLHVVFDEGSTIAINNTAILDGFVISGGNANGTNAPNHVGGGISNFGSSPTLTNLTISGNSAGNSGGGYIIISAAQP